MKKITAFLLFSAFNGAYINNAFSMLVKQSKLTKKYLRTYATKKYITPIIFTRNIDYVDEHVLRDMLYDLADRNNNKIRELNKKINPLNAEKQLLEKQSNIIEDYLDGDHSPAYMIDDYALRNLETQLKSLKKRNTKELD